MFPLCLQLPWTALSIQALDSVILFSGQYCPFTPWIFIIEWLGSPVVALSEFTQGGGTGGKLHGGSVPLRDLEKHIILEGSSPTHVD